MLATGFIVGVPYSFMCSITCSTPFLLIAAGPVVIAHFIPKFGNLYFSLLWSVLLEVCQFYWSFQSTSCVSVIFSIALFLISLISVLLFIISCLLLALISFCSSFSWFLRWELVLLRLFFFSNMCNGAINYRVCTILAVSYKFWCCIFIQVHVYFLTELRFMTHGMVYVVYVPETENECLFCCVGWSVLQMPIRLWWLIVLLGPSCWLSV